MSLDCGRNTTAVFVELVASIHTAIYGEQRRPVVVGSQEVQ